jgi:signal transduction histidine kinase
MYTEAAKTAEAVTTPELLTGLDAIRLGLFRLNQEGYIDQFNQTASRIFGVDMNTAWDGLHIAQIDRFLGTGLAEKLSAVLSGSTIFIRTNVSCTNSCGRFMVLNLCCVRAGDGQGGAWGVVEDLGRSQDRLDTLRPLLGELKILTEVSAALSSSYELDQVLKVIMTAATASQGLGFNRVFLFMHDEARHHLLGHLAIGPSNAEEAGRIWQNLESMQLTLSDLLNRYEDDPGNRSDAITNLITGLEFDLNPASVVAETCQSGRWVNLEKRLDIDASSAGFLDRLGTRRLALVPLMSKGRFLGLLAADNYITGREISDDAGQLLQLLANQAAVAMEKAQLYDEQKERTCELERINTLLADSQDQIIKIEKMSIIGELTSAIAHELRNPLTVIGGFANMMLKSDVPDDLREYLNIIASETKRTESVLDHVLDFHKASKCESCLIEFSDLVERNLRLLLGRLHRPDVKIDISLAREKLMIYGNRDQLSHAVYQIFKLVGEELIPPGTAAVRTEIRDNRAVAVITFDCRDGARQQLVRTLKQVFTDNKASQRLSIMVAGETLKHHGGNYGIGLGADGGPSIYVEIPLVKESTSG